MNDVPQLFADHETLLFVASVLIQVTLLIVLALASGRLLRHRPALRHSVLVGGLICVLVCPAARYFAERLDVPLISIAWPSDAASETSPLPESVVSVSTDQSSATVALHTPNDLTEQPAVERFISEDRPDTQPVTYVDDTAHRVSGTRRPSVIASEVELNAVVAPLAEDPAPEPTTIASALPGETPTALSDGSVASLPDWINVSSILAVVWLAGLVVISTRLMLAWRYLNRLRLNATPLDEERLPQFQPISKEVLTAVAAKRLPDILVSDELKGPVSLGLFRSAIVLPSEMVQALTTCQIRDVLIHEMAHIHRRDHLVVVLQRLAGAIFWPFPLVWRLNERIDEAREDVCDNYVLRHTEASQYSRMLLQLTERAAPQTIPLAIGLWKYRRNLEQRVTAILDPRRTTGTRLPSLTLGMLTVALVSIAVLLAGSRIIPTGNVQAAESESSQPASARSVQEGGQTIQPADGETAQPETEKSAKDVALENEQSNAGEEEQKTLSVAESASPEHAATLANDKRSEVFKGADGAFNNRPYWWVRPKNFPLHRFIRIGVGDDEELTRQQQIREQAIEIEKAGWLHIALADEGPGNAGRLSSEFAKEHGWEKTDTQLGYRVPKQARATRMFVYRKKVPVGQLTLPRVNWSGPVILLPAIAQVDQVAEAKDQADPYDVLYDVIMTRWKDGKAYGQDETSPAVFSWSEFPFDDQTFDKFNAALDAFAALPQEDIEQYSDVHRALMQRNLWELFETTFNWEWSSDWWWDGQRSFPKTHIERRAIAQPKLASLVKRLALTKEEILALPNTLAATIKSGQFAEAHDPADPFKPFLPEDFYSGADSSWVCLGEDGEEIPADLHTWNRHNRSMFLQFMRLPGGRAATLEYMERISKRPHQFPVGTQFALVEQPLLISKEGELVVSPLVVAVQLRAYLDVGRDFRRSDDNPKATQCVAEFVMQPRQLMRGNAVMRAMGPKDFHFDAGAKTATPGFSPRDPFMKGKLGGSLPPPRLEQCMHCHNRAGGRGVRTRSFRGTYDFFTEISPEEVGKETVKGKHDYDNWKVLQKYWRGEPVELPKPIAETKPEAKPKPEPMPDRFPDTPQLRAALFKAVENEVASELKKLHSAVLLSEAAKLTDTFNLDESASGKLSKAAREAADSAVEKARGTIQKSFGWNANYILNKKTLVDGSLSDPDLTAFRFNDRFIILDENDQDPADRNKWDSVGWRFARHGSSDMLRVGFRFGTFGNVVGPKDADVQNEEVWKKALSAVLTEEQVTQYAEHRSNRLKTAVVDMMVMALQFDLDLDDSQMPALRKRIEERVQIGSAYDIERTVGAELQRLKAEAFGDLLSEEQLNAFPEHPQARIKSTVISLMMTALRFDLHLAESHLPALRKRLEEQINPGALSSSVESKAMRSRWGLKEKQVADILSEPELVLWRLTQEQHN